MKEQDDVFDLVQADEISALLPELLSAKEIAATRCERATASGYIEAIKTPQPEPDVEKLVRLVLQPAVRARDYEGMGPVSRPFFERHFTLIEIGTTVLPQCIANVAESASTIGK